MIDAIRAVLYALMKANLMCRLENCVFVTNKVEYLGFVISNGKLKPGAAKVKAIREFPEPRNVHEVRCWLGLTGFFRRFVPNYAQMAAPLTKLLRKNASFEWSEQQQVVFNELKNVLTTDPVLALFDPTAETELHTDASAAGVAAMLLQRRADGQFHLVYCVVELLRTPNDFIIPQGLNC